MKKLTFQWILLLVVFFLACEKRTEEGKGGMKTPMTMNKIGPTTKKTKRPRGDLKNVKVGHRIDQHNGVPIYFNGRTLHTQGRHVSKDGYNYGLKWQCVEFVKRYYYDHLKHKMPDTFGHAKDFFLTHLKDGDYNPQRDLVQFRNGGLSPPKVNDIVVFVGDEFGHVAIITKVGKDEIEIVQQNVGIATRHTIPLLQSKGRNYVLSKAVIGWLGKRAH